jgi:hypothetical protein
MTEATTTLTRAEFTQVERFLPSSRGFVGRPPKDRVALARAFVAKAVLDLPTTEALIGRCGGSAVSSGFMLSQTPMRFSRGFAQFTTLELPAWVHEALIRSRLGDQIIGQVARDATEIEAREKPAHKVKPVILQLARE